MPRFYLLHGLDEFASAEYAAGLQAQLGDPTAVALNLSLFDGRTVTLAAVRAAAGAMPFLADRRLVIVDGWLTRLLGKGEADEAPAEAPRGEALTELAAYLPDLPETAALVLVEKRVLPERNPVLKAAAGQPWAHIQRFDLPQGEALVKWILARATAEGGAFTREAAQALAAAERDPRALQAEIAKLITHTGLARPVEVADVQALTPAGSEAHIFDFVDQLGQRQARAAQRELHRLLDKEEPLYVLAMIIRQYRYLVQARELLDDRRHERDVAQALNLHPFPAGKICAQARQQSLPALEAVYRRLLTCDAEIKTGRAEPGAALDVLVLELTRATA